MKLNIAILCFCILVGYVCSKASSIELNVNKKTDIQKLIDVIEEWKTLDTNNK